jgi:peptidoglycan/LPS O-acetylase OafA/YrhL
MSAIISPWPYFAFMVLFLVVAHLLARVWPEGAARLNVPMESLRGLLATGVFFCHAVVTYFYFKTGTWQPPPSLFYGFLGSGTVDVFFFLSGFLFWSKCISDDGVRGKKAFFAARARRIIPGYYASLVLILLIVLAETGFSLRVRPAEFGLELLVWLTFCIPNLLQPINGLQHAPLVNAAVIWTLQLEIVFYAILPFLYRVFKGYGVLAYLGILTGTFWSLGRIYSVQGANWTEQPVPMLLARFFAFGFGFGMLAAFLVSKCPKTWLEKLRERRWSFIPIVFLASPVLLGVRAHSFFQFMLLLVPFVFVVAGNDLFGLLSMRSTLLLGKASYSFYVTHGIVLYGLSHLLNRWLPIAGLAPISYWCFMGCCGIIAVCLSYFLYRNVEIRFMKKGSVLRQAGIRTRIPSASPPRSTASAPCN